MMNTGMREHVPILSAASQAQSLWHYAVSTIYGTYDGLMCLPAMYHPSTSKYHQALDCPLGTRLGTLLKDKRMLADPEQF